MFFSNFLTADLTATAAIDSEHAMLYGTLRVVRWGLVGLLLAMAWLFVMGWFTGTLFVRAFEYCDRESERLELLEAATGPSDGFEESLEPTAPEPVLEVVEDAVNDSEDALLVGELDAMTSRQLRAKATELGIKHRNEAGKVRNSKEFRTAIYCYYYPAHCQ